VLKVPLNPNQPNCDHCGSPLTVEHIQNACSSYRNIRKKISLPWITQHIFSYLSKINIFSKLQTLNFFMARCSLFVLKVLLKPNQPTCSRVYCMSAVTVTGRWMISYQTVRLLSLCTADFVVNIQKLQCDGCRAKT